MMAGGEEVVGPQLPPLTQGDAAPVSYA